MANLQVVQFLHPGGEHQLHSRHGRDWNRHPHQRSFLGCPGAYLDGGRLVAGELVFWGEWEPQVNARTAMENPHPGFPSFIAEPYYELPEAFDGHQNTDPFVFSSPFLYGICQQHRTGRATGMQALARGSLILFGAHSGGVFLLDTVFVIADSIEYSPETAEQTLRGRVPDGYMDVVLGPWFGWLRSGGRGWRDHQARLYLGATPEDPVEGMFSFFPCLSRQEAPDGFERPVFRHRRYIVDALRQSRRTTPMSDLTEALSAWQSAVDAVTDPIGARPLRLGIRADFPPRRTRSGTHQS